MIGEFLADCHALAISQGAPRGGGSPLRPDFPVWGKPGKATRCLPDPAPSKKEGTRIYRDFFHRMAAIKPDLHASESPEGQSLRMQGCGEEGSHATKTSRTPFPPQRRKRGFVPPKGGVSGPAPPRHVHGVLTTPPSGTAGERRIHGGTDARSMRLCARALRPLAHPAAHSHAQGTRVASTAGTRRSPRAVA